MPTNIQLTTEYIPYGDNLYVQRLRKFLNDTAELNTLEVVEECTNVDLYHYIQDSLDEINYEFTPASSYTIASFPSWNTLKIGATLQFLVSKGILSARNTLTYNDSGGVTVSDYDRYGRYMAYYNMLVTKYMRGVQSIKVSSNIDSCYGGVASEYSVLHNDDLQD